MNWLIRSIAAAPYEKRNKAPHRLIFGRRFNGNTSRRLLILFKSNRISYASVFPFLQYAEAFQSRYDVEIRCLPVEQALNHGIPDGLARATHVLAQTWLTEPRANHEKLELLFSAFPDGVRSAYLDTFANNDVRWLNIFKSANLYYKKSIFIDRSLFTSPTYGHTNLSDYYSRLYNLEEEMMDWRVSPDCLSKLRLAPNFLTDAELSTAILSQPSSGAWPKDIDLHARLGGTGDDGWYGAMRRHAAKRVDALDGLRVVTGTGVSRGAFRKELIRSKVCFSPFGYGELCWRDIEAIAAKAVLIKPSMSHLSTEPDLYRDGETYIACRWDFADLEDKLNEILQDDLKRHLIADKALQVARNYLETAGPVSTYEDLFSS